MRPTTPALPPLPVNPVAELLSDLLFEIDVLLFTTDPEYVSLPAFMDTATVRADLTALLAEGPGRVTRLRWLRAATMTSPPADPEAAERQTPAPVPAPWQEPWGIIDHDDTGDYDRFCIYYPAAEKEDQPQWGRPPTSAVEQYAYANFDGALRPAHTMPRWARRTADPEEGG